MNRSQQRMTGKRQPFTKKNTEQKLKEIDKEAQAILSEARKKAMKTENEIVAEAKEEAARIITRANNEIELEREACA